MSRLTKKQGNLYYSNNENDIFPDDGSNAIRLLQVIGQYEDLEEELGIDLLTLFKALKDGIYYNPSDDFFKKPRLYYSNDFNCWCFELALGAYIVKIKDFNKTWWIEKPKENEDD